MIIVEYRVPMPFSAAEYRIGQLYTIAMKSRLESADAKNGVRIDANEAYTNGPGGSGQYTNKTYYMARRIPDWMKRLLPESAAKLREEAWNAYPYSRSKYSNPLLDKLSLDIESHYIDGPPNQDNVFRLSAEEAKLRTVVLLDLASDSHTKAQNAHVQTRPVACARPAEPKRSHSGAVDKSQILSFEPLHRAPLTKNWLREYEESAGEAEIAQDDYEDQIGRHLMTCYKLCRISCPIWPLQNRIESFIQQYCRDTIMESHRQAWVWQDEWTGMSLDDIRLMERETQSMLFQVMRQTAPN